MIGVGTRYEPRSRHPAVGKLVLSVIAGVGCVSASVFSAQVAGAATDSVTNCSGSPTHPGSLPYEVANASSGDTISFSVSCPASSPIVIGSSIKLKKPLVITGPGADRLVVSGNNAVRVFNISVGVQVALSGITVEKGSAITGGGILDLGPLKLTNSILSGNSAIDGGSGGGIYSTSSVTITSSTIEANTVNDGGVGGGIYSQGSLAINHSSIVGNTAYEGGGILNKGPLTAKYSAFLDNSSSMDGGGIADIAGTDAITDSTFTGNDSGHGGAIFTANNGIANTGIVKLTASTVVGNTAFSTGGGVAGLGGRVTMGATIVAANVNEGNVPSQGNCGVGSFTSVGYNLTNDSTGALCEFTQTTDIVKANPDLGPLRNNGGPTLTMLPGPTSPAAHVIPMGTTLNGVLICPGTDQRGFVRPQPGETACTIGAVEAG